MNKKVDLQNNMQDVIDLIKEKKLSVPIQEVRPIDQPTVLKDEDRTSRLTVEISKSIHKKLKKVATDQERKISSLVNEALVEYLKKQS